MNGTPLNPLTTLGGFEEAFEDGSPLSPAVFEEAVEDGCKM